MAGDACVATGPCPTGYKLVNSGCFQIVSDLDQSLRTNACGVNGSVFGSGNFLCSTKVLNTSCASNADCPSGTACKTHFRGNYCIAVC